MALCALTAARVRDGAIINMTTKTSTLLADVHPDIYLAAAEAVYPLKLVDADSFDYLRASGLLAALAIQNGKPNFMHQHMGNYFTLVTLHGMNDETRWPPDIGEIEREERRRLVSVSSDSNLLY